MNGHGRTNEGKKDGWLDGRMDGQALLRFRPIKSAILIREHSTNQLLALQQTERPWLK